MKKYQKETKSSQQKKKASKTLNKETININQLIRRTSNKKLKKKKRSNSSHPFKQSTFSQNQGGRVSDYNDLLMSSFGSQVVSSSKLKNSIVRTGMRSSGFGKVLQNPSQNTFGKVLFYF